MADTELLRDEPADPTVTSSETVFEGAVWNVVRDVVDYNGSPMTREYVAHTGAVAVLAVDEHDRVLVIKQYRHPIRTRDWELPAGLLDAEGESKLDAAKRELAEEADLAGASSSEFDPETEFPVVATMAEQVDIIAGGDLGGTMRLGLYPAALTSGSLAAELYGSELVEERHRHRYEVNNQYRQQIADAGLVFSGTSPDGTLVEYVELDRSVHPFYIGTQAHPELRSRPNHAHPLFSGLVEASLERQNSSKLFADEADAAEVVA